MTRIAIIGAGLTGLTVANLLRPHADVTVFEKSRGFGGRIATRYAGNFEFDHGAQFFTARSKAFRDFLQPMIDAGVVAIWEARFVELQRQTVAARRIWNEEYPHFVGAPRMNCIGSYLADKLLVRREEFVAQVKADPAGWRLENADGQQLGSYDWVVFAVPAAQSAALIPPAIVFRDTAASKNMRACFALMLGFDSPLEIGWDAARVRDADISWISVNSSKPGRSDVLTLVVHSTNAWADENHETDSQDVIDHLVAETSAVIDQNVSSAAHCGLQRWRYANIDRQAGGSCYIDGDNKIAACGDWFVRGRVEAAFTSGRDLATALIAQL